MEFAEFGDAERLLIEARWQGVPTCPTCGTRPSSAEATAAWTVWRCGRCRRRFTVTSGTRIHSTKLAPSDWVAVVAIEPPTAPGIADAIGVSQVTARRLSALLQPVSGRSSTDRLAHLVQNRHEPATAQDPWQIDPLPATLRHRDSPLPSLSDGAKAVLNALRARPFAATAAKLAELADVSYSQTLRCLAAFERRGWARGTKTSTQHGYEMRTATLWSLSWSDSCMQALSFLRDRPTQQPKEAEDRIPARFWRNFWSGASADTLMISRHGLHIAETLIGGHDVCARAWALSTLPTSLLRECRALRGFDKGPPAEMLDAEIARRTATT